MSPSSYAELVRELFPRLTGGIRWGTDRVERILSAVGDPHRRFRSLHVGGTNGKGSTAAFLAAVLEETGRRIGLYTSPHLCTFRERIRIAGEPIGEAALLEAAHALWPAIMREGASFFEATTAIAFQAFAEAGVEVAVVEVGLGGRLDATNVIVPEVVALTNVALDHAEYLGEELEAVAAEKAGIIKPDVPVVTTATDPVVLEVFRRRAAEVGAPLDEVAGGELEANGGVVPGSVQVETKGTAFRVRTDEWGELELRTRLVGVHQAQNAALALRALERLSDELRPDRDAVVRGIARARLDGRMQIERREGGTWVFDVAHNPAGVEALIGTLGRLRLPEPLVFVVGVLGDKDWAAMVPPLRELADFVVLTSPASAPEERRWEPETVRDRLGGEGIEVVAELEQALERARAMAAGGTVVVTGSFHTVGDALLALGLASFECDDEALPGLASGA